MTLEFSIVISLSINKDFCKVDNKAQNWNMISQDNAP